MQNTQMNVETSRKKHPPVAGSISWLTFGLSGGFLVMFVVAAIIDLKALSLAVSVAANWSITYFGLYWQILLLLTFLIGLAVAISPWAKVRLGNAEKPEMHTLQWFSIIMCTLLAGGGVFFAAGEPMSHYVSPPPLYGVDGFTEQAAYAALSQSYMHWGFLSWAILGSLTTIVFMYTHYQEGLPLRPRSLLFPVLGKAAIESPLGAVVDACCAVAIVAGTVGPIGFAGLQVSYGLSDLFGLPDIFATQLAIILALIGVYTISSATGITRGIQVLSAFNLVLALALMTFILIFGPSTFIVTGYLKSAALHITNFFSMATYRGDEAWLGAWTIFFWGWFLGFGPLMAMFIARISNGRTIREVIICLSICAPIVTTFWFTIVGGAGIAFELTNPGTISEPFDGSNMPAALLAITRQLPAGLIVSALFLILTTLFVATTGDSMSYTISMVMTGSDNPPASLRVFWGIMMGVVAIILVSIGSGGISSLQYFIIVTAVPVSIVLLPSLWTGPLIARRMSIALRDAEDTEEPNDREN